MWRARQGAFVWGTLKAKGEVLCVTAGRLRRGARYISSFPYFSPIARSAPRVFHARPAFLPSSRVRESEGVVNFCVLAKYFLVPLLPHEECLQNHRRGVGQDAGAAAACTCRQEGRRSVDNQTLRRPAISTQTRGAMRLSPQFLQTRHYPR